MAVDRWRFGPVGAARIAVVSQRLPGPDAARIAATVPGADELVEVPAGTRVLRIHPLAGAHPCAWNDSRFYGPTSARFDHHPPPPHTHPTRSVIYGALGDEAFTAAIAEFFQDDAGTVGPIDRVLRAPAATAFTLAAPIRVLDLRTGWVTRAGGNQAIMSGSRSRARDWARAIYRSHTDVQGLMYASSVWGPGLCVAIWDRGAAGIPAANDLHRSLVDPVMDGPLAVAAGRLGTVLVP